MTNSEIKDLLIGKFKVEIHPDFVLVDKKASKPIKKLHKKLIEISKRGFAIGHQDATAYGIGWKHIDSLNIIDSDVNKVIGDFPAVYGFDIGHI